MIAIFDPTARMAAIVFFALGVAAGCWVHDKLWWLVMHRAWVRAHEVRRRRRLRRIRGEFR